MENVFAFVNGLFIVQTSGYISSLNSQDGSLVLKLYENKGDLSIRELDTHNNLIYIEDGESGRVNNSNNNNDLIAVDLITGNKIWGNGLLYTNGLEYDYDAFGGTAFQITHDYIFYDNDTDLIVFNKDDGSLINIFPQERRFKPYYSDNGFIVYFPEVGIAKGINPVTSDILWENDEFNKDEQFSDDFIYRYADIIILRDYPSYELYAIDQTTGKELWRKQIEIYFLGNAPNYESLQGQ